MNGATVLVADDDAGVRTVLGQALGRAGYNVRTTDSAAGLWHWIAAGDGDVVITDVVMPDENGLDLIQRIRKIRPDLRIIVMSARNTLATAVQAAERGAFDYLPKPFDLDRMVATVKRALSIAPPAAPTLGADPDTLADRIPLVGRSPAMQEVYRAIARLAQTDLTVLIEGESGTGKELVARALHGYGKRRARPFVALNMAAIPRDLIESELFGHERGAFTGAAQRSEGRFAQAHGGTLFLDEIGDMPLDAQTRLLRVLQEGEFTSVGGRTPIRADVRILAATHHSLARLVQQGLFREDLFFRINVVPVFLPPLRQRIEDIGELVQTFLGRAAAGGLPWKTFDPGAMERLRRHTWPGNVRELENLVRRLTALCADDIITAAVVAREFERDTQVPELAAEDDGNGIAGSVERQLRTYFAAHGDRLPAVGLYDRVLREVERPLIRLALDATRGNQIRAAHLLGLNRNTLRKKLRDLDIAVSRGGAK